MIVCLIRKTPLCPHRPRRSPPVRRATAARSAILPCCMRIVTSAPMPDWCERVFAATFFHSPPVAPCTRSHNPYPSTFPMCHFLSSHIARAPSHFSLIRPLPSLLLYASTTRGKSVEFNGDKLNSMEFVRRRTRCGARSTKHSTRYYVETQSTRKIFSLSTQAPRNTIVIDEFVRFPAKKHYFFEHKVPVVLTRKAFLFISQFV